MRKTTTHQEAKQAVRTLGDLVEQAGRHYESTAPDVAEYLGRLATRIGIADHSVRLYEITVVLNLYRGDEWDSPELARQKVFSIPDYLRAKDEVDAAIKGVKGNDVEAVIDEQVAISRSREDEIFGLKAANQVDTPGPRIKAARLAAGLTQVQLAERLGVTQGQITQVETGRRGCSLEWLAKASEAIGCSPSILSEKLA